MVLVASSTKALLVHPGCHCLGVQGSGVDIAMCQELEKEALDTSVSAVMIHKMSEPCLIVGATESEYKGLELAFLGLDPDDAVSLLRKARTPNLRAVVGQVFTRLHLMICAVDGPDHRAGGCVE